MNMSIMHTCCLQKNARRQDGCVYATINQLFDLWNEVFMVLPLFVKHYTHSSYIDHVYLYSANECYKLYMLVIVNNI